MNEREREGGGEGGSKRAVVGKPDHGAIHALFAAQVPDLPTKAHRPRVLVQIGSPTWLEGGSVTAAPSWATLGIGI